MTDSDKKRLEDIKYIVVEGIGEMLFALVPDNQLPKGAMMIKVDGDAVLYRSKSVFIGKSNDYYMTSLPMLIKMIDSLENAGRAVTIVTHEEYKANQKLVMELLGGIANG